MLEELSTANVDAARVNLAEAAVAELVEVLPGDALQTLEVANAACPTTVVALLRTTSADSR